MARLTAPAPVQFSPARAAAFYGAYYLRGKEFRESTGETDPNKAEKFLKRRLKEVGADQIGAKAFVGPQQERVKISELLDALEAIRASGVPFTFVQPTGFMSNLLAWATSIKAEGIVRASTGEGRRAFIHSDAAAVATKALTPPEYDGESLPITGPEALSFAEVTAKIGSAIGVFKLRAGGCESSV